MTTLTKEDYTVYLKTGWSRRGPDPIAHDRDFSYALSHDYLSQVDNDSKLPGWRKLIREGKCATTLSNGFRQRHSYKPYWFSCESSIGVTWSGTLHSQDWEDLPVVQPWPQLLVDKALTNYISKANEVLQAFQGFTFLGELLETIGMITNPANAFKRGVMDYLKHARKDRVTRKHIERAKRSKSLGAFTRLSSGLWLEAALGWQPLLGDIDSGCDALTRWREPVRRLIPIRGYAEDRQDTKVSSETVNVGPLAFYRERWLRSRESVVFRGRVIWDPNQMLAGDDFKYWGFSLEDVVPAGWNLIPGSFLLDYFTNIGDVVNGWSFGSSNVAWTDRLVRRDLRYHFANQSVPGWLSGQSPSGAPPTRIAYELEQLDNRVETHDRRVWVGDYTPNFHWELPVSARKLANIGALLAQSRVK